MPRRHGRGFCDSRPPQPASKGAPVSAGLRSQHPQSAVTLFPTLFLFDSIRSAHILSVGHVMVAASHRASTACAAIPSSSTIRMRNTRVLSPPTPRSSADSTRYTTSAGGGDRRPSPLWSITFAPLDTGQPALPKMPLSARASGSRKPSTSTMTVRATHWATHPIPLRGPANG